MSHTSAANAFLRYYRCPERYSRLEVGGQLSKEPGYFRSGPDIIGFGRTVEGSSVSNEAADGTLPFDFTEVVDSLRLERYPEARAHFKAQSLIKRVVKNAYYLGRPLLPVKLRKRLQQLYLSDWTRIPFPRWPVDCGVEYLCEHAVKVSLQAIDAAEMPFVWFWPAGYQGCIIMTHDVETEAGRDFCSQLMDLDDRFGIKSSFQVVPEKRYRVTESLLEEMRSRGFEINVHGLDHDGHLFDERNEFLRQARRINAYAKAYGALGFRSPVLYRNVDWFDALEFSYDMSLPNIGHLDPQRGGCCTVMPFFIGNMVELPLTTTQDYSLFNIIGDFSIDLWQRQISAVIERHGLLSFLVHPDYILNERERNVYEHLLAYIASIAREHRLWLARPADVAAWWAQRDQLKIVSTNGKWCIDGEGKETATLAYARLVDGRIRYHMHQTGDNSPFASEAA